MRALPPRAAFSMWVSQWCAREGDWRAGTRPSAGWHCSHWCVWWEQAGESLASMLDSVSPQGKWSLGSIRNLSCFTVTLWYVDNHATFYQKLSNYSIWICKLPITKCLSHMVIWTTKDNLVLGFNFEILLWFCTSPTRGRFDSMWSDLAAKEQPPPMGLFLTLNKT